METRQNEKLGACISLLVFLILWVIYGVCVRFWDRKYRAAGVSFLLLIPLTVGVNYIVDLFIREAETNQTTALFNTILLGVLALFCFSADYYKNRLGN